MTGAELYTLNTEIRGGRELDEVTFYILANLAKSQFERRRAWRKLVTKNSSNQATPSTTPTTAFTMPTNFIMTLPRRTMKLVSGNSVIPYDEVPYENWDEYKNSQGKFAIDHANSQFYISGSVSDTYTINLFYIGTTADIESATSWVFPSEFHPAIAFEVAAMDELGMDYDDINARQGNANIQRAELIMRGAVKWDDALQRSALGV